MADLVGGSPKTYEHREFGEQTLCPLVGIIEEHGQFPWAVSDGAARGAEAALGLGGRRGTVQAHLLRQQPIQVSDTRGGMRERHEVGRGCGRVAKACKKSFSTIPRARDDQKTMGTLLTPDQELQGLTMGGAPIQELRIRRECKRMFRQAIQRLHRSVFHR